MARKRPSDDCANIENKRSKASTSHDSECDNEGAKNSSERKRKRNVM